MLSRLTMVDGLPITTETTTRTTTDLQMSTTALMPRKIGLNGFTTPFVQYNNKLVGQLPKNGSRLFILKSRAHTPTMAKIRRLVNEVTLPLLNHRTGRPTSSIKNRTISTKRVKVSAWLLKGYADSQPDRTQLLVHLLMSTPHVEMSISGEPRSTKEITAEMLKEPLDTKKHENVNKELLKRFHIVQSIIEVRTQLESFEAGGIGRRKFPV